MSQNNDLIFIYLLIISSYKYWSIAKKTLNLTKSHPQKITFEEYLRMAVRQGQVGDNVGGKRQGL